MKLCAINDRPGRWVLLNQSGKLSSKGSTIGRARQNSWDHRSACRIACARAAYRVGNKSATAGVSLGAHISAAAQIRTGKSRISAGRLYELGKVLGVPITFFFEDIADTLTPVTLLETGDHTEELGRREAGELFAGIPRHIRPTATSECTTTCQSSRTGAERFNRK